MSRWADRAWGLVTYAAAVAIVVVSVFPFAWAVATSLKSGTALFDTAIFRTPSGFGNYVAVFSQQPFGRNILNSVFVAVCVVALALGLALLASHALGRVRFRGRGLLLGAILVVSMFPQVAILSGMYELVRVLGLYNRLPALILADLTFTVPFTTWVLTTYMRALPMELEEAATIDGASPWIVLTRVFLPLLRPAMAATGLLAFIAAWNEFLYALTFTFTDEQRTVPVAIAQFSGASQFELPWGNIMAGSVVVTAPLILLVLGFQRHIIAGLNAGAVKG